MNIIKIQPSSSARAAELLEASGSAPSGFLGFGALGSDLVHRPSAIGGEDPEYGIDADFSLTLKKLTKRDATTKLKVYSDVSSLSL